MFLMKYYLSQSDLWLIPDITLSKMMNQKFDHSFIKVIFLLMVFVKENRTKANFLVSIVCNAKLIIVAI